ASALSPRSTLFPYTTLFRSILVSKAGHCLSDLGYRERSDRLPIEVVGVVSNHRDLEPMVEFYGYPFHHIPVTPETKPAAEARLRSEEHTSELQSRENLVCRL